MLVFIKKKTALLICIILNLFIFFDIINGAGIVHVFFMKMNSLFLALYCIIIYTIFIFALRWKVDKIQLWILWIMLWQLLISMLMQSEISLNMIYQITGWPLLFVIVYHLTRKGRFTLPTLKYTSFLWIFASVYVVYILRTQMFNDVYRTYYLIISIPFFICTKEKWKYSRLFLITIIIALTYKRTGFMALIIAFVMYFWCDMIIQKKQSKKTYKMLLMTILLTILILLFNQYGSSIGVLRRLKRISFDNGSNRFTIWKILMDYFTSENLLNKLMGNGYKACYWILEGTFAAAHNDFIEILLDYGMIGLVNHIIFIILVGKKAYKLIKAKISEASSYIYMFTVWIILMLFSFITWQSILMKPVALYFAYMLAKYKYINSEIKIKEEKNDK